MVRGGINWAALSGALVAAAVCARGADSERGFTTETQRHREERTSQRSGRAFAPVLLCASAPLWCDADDPPIAEGGPVGQQLSGDIPLLADKPDRVIDLPDAESVESIAFLPDGKSLIVHMQVRAINVWELLHHYWPEEIGALLAIALLVLIRAAVHVRMHPQRKGEPHCRGCGYCLTGVAPGPCPECGLDKRAGNIDRGRVIGRSALRRLRWAMVLVIVIGAAYGGMFAAGVGRWSRAYETFPIWSTQLYRLAQNLDVAWLLSRTEFVERYVEFDRNHERQGYAYSGSERANSSLLFDGSFIPESNGYWIERRNGENGRMLKRVSVQDAPLLGRCEKFLVDLPERDGHAVILETIAMHSEDVERDLPIFKWNLDDNSVTVISRHAIEAEAKAIEELWNSAAADLQIIRPQPESDGFWIHAFTPDRSRIFCLVSRTPEFVVADFTPNGKWKPVWRASSIGFRDRWAISNDGKTLALVHEGRPLPVSARTVGGGIAGPSGRTIELYTLP